MTQTARSVFVFGLYLLVLGAGLVVAPNLILDIFEVPNTREVWIRVLGTVLIYVGVYYVQAARHDLTPIFKVSVPVRLSLIVVLAVFVVLDYVEPIVIVFGVADALGALWTVVALHREAAV